MVSPFSVHLIPIFSLLFSLNTASCSSFFQFSPRKRFRFHGAQNFREGRWGLNAPINKPFSAFFHFGLFNPGNRRRVDNNFETQGHRRTDSNEQRTQCWKTLSSKSHQSITIIYTIQHSVQKPKQALHDEGAKCARFFFSLPTLGSRENLTPSLTPSLSRTRALHSPLQGLHSRAS